MAKVNEGKRFEEDWQNSFKKVDCYFQRIKDSATSFSGGQTSFTSSNPYDCFALYDGIFVPMELKSTEGTSISFEKEGSGKGNKMLKLHQIKCLELICKQKNVYAGFVFNFRKTHNTYWIDIRDFLKFYNETEKFSINENDAILHNAIKIDSKLLKVRYRYDVIKILQDIKERGEQHE